MLKKCEYCEGKGIIEDQADDQFGNTTLFTTTCPDCEGDGLEAIQTKLKFYSREALQEAVMILDCNLIEWDFVKFEKCGIWEIEIFE